MTATSVRRLLFAVPTLIAISFIAIFALLDLAPNDPTGQLPLTIPAEVREQIRESFGLDEPFHVRYAKWMEQFFVNEPLNLDRAGVRRRDRRFRFAPAGALVGDAKPRGRPHHRADAADALGGRPLLPGRHPHRASHRHRLGLPAVLLVRPARHLRLHDRLLRADLLHRAARDHRLQRDAAVAAVDLRHHAPGHRSGELLGADQADHRCR